MSTRRHGRKRLKVTSGESRKEVRWMEKVKKIEEGGGGREKKVESKGDEERQVECRR